MLITISRITMINPCVFRHAEDLDKSLDEARFLVHDSMEDVLELGGAIYIKIAQLCSVMSVYWLMGKVGVPYKDLSPLTQQEIAAVVVKNNTPAEQFNWAKKELGYNETSAKAEAVKLGPGSKVLLYTIRHVSAAVVGPNGKWRVYDPETASAEEYRTEDTEELYLEHCSRFLYGR